MYKKHGASQAAEAGAAGSQVRLKEKKCGFIACQTSFQGGSIQDEGVVIIQDGVVSISDNFALCCFVVKNYVPIYRPLDWGSFYKYKAFKMRKGLEHKDVKTRNLKTKH